MLESLFIELTGFKACDFTLTQPFLVNIAKFSGKTFLQNTPPVAASSEITAAGTGI